MEQTQLQKNYKSTKALESTLGLNCPRIALKYSKC